MHATFFGIKRAHWRAVAVTRELIRWYELTPARFDMLRIVVLQPDGITQADLQWLLGVSAPTVSRMLKSLEQKGFVVRSTDERDARRLRVRLTVPGRCAVKMCLEATIVSHEAERTAALAVLGKPLAAATSSDEVSRTIAEGREALAQFDPVVSKIRRTLLDPAPFRHPWHAGNYSMIAYAA